MLHNRRVKSNKKVAKRKAQRAKVTDNEQEVANNKQKEPSKKQQ